MRIWKVIIFVTILAVHAAQAADKQALISRYDCRAIVERIWIQSELPGEKWFEVPSLWHYALPRELPYFRGAPSEADFRDAYRLVNPTPQLLSHSRPSDYWPTCDRISEFLREIGRPSEGS